MSRLANWQNPGTKSPGSLTLGDLGTPSPSMMMNSSSSRAPKKSTRAKKIRLSKMTARHKAVEKMSRFPGEGRTSEDEEEQDVNRPQEPSFFFFFYYEMTTSERPKRGHERGVAPLKGRQLSTRENQGSAPIRVTPQRQSECPRPHREGRQTHRVHEENDRILQGRHDESSG